MRKYHYIKRTRILTLALCVAGCAAFGQEQSGTDQGGGPPPPPPHGRPPLPPVVQALDTNHDGIIEADEIANASTSLKTLLKSGSTELTIPDLMGPPPHGRHHRPPPPGGGPTTSGTGAANADGQDGPPPPPDGAQPPPPPPDGGPGGRGGPGGPRGRHHGPPPVIKALDANHDGVVDANEIANAPAELKTLLKNGATELKIPDLLGPPPGGPRGHRPPGGPGNDGPPPPPPDGNGPDGNPPPPPPSDSGTNGQAQPQ